MAQSFSLSSAPAIFACPTCRQTINTSMSQCSFCATPIDAVSAQAAAEAMSRISQACSDASYLKVLAGLLIPFYLLQLVIFLSLAGVVGFWFLLFAIPVMTARWWIQFRAIRTDDPEFARARRTAVMVSVLAVVCILLIFVKAASFFH